MDGCQYSHLNLKSRNMNLIETDSHYVWHPYTQMQTAPDPVGIVRGEGAYLYGEDGTKYFDAVASWWVNLHGHSHPYIAKKVCEQQIGRASCRERVCQYV